MVRCSGARVFLTPSHVKASFTAAIVVRSLWAALGEVWVLGLALVVAASCPMLAVADTEVVRVLPVQLLTFIPVAPLETRRERAVGAERREHATHEPLIRSMMVADVPLTGRSFAGTLKRFLPPVCLQ